MSKSEDVARTLLGMRASGRRIPPADWSGPPVASLADGYSAQDALTKILSAELNQTIIGYKIGATNQTARDLLGVSEPFFGRLYAEQTHPAGSVIDAGAIYVVAEPEIAVEIGHELSPDAAPFDAAAIEAATSALLPAIEIIASGFDPWTGAGGPTIIADNGAHGLWVPGEPMSDWSGFDVLDGEIEVNVTGHDPMTGRGGAVDGGPFAAAAWLANALAARGEPLRAGTRISTGTVTPPIALSPGMRIDASYGALGTISVEIGGA
ncbi:MAG: hypothetical protein AAF409_19455 [Pseudomonadota bacterium]